MAILVCFDCDFTILLVRHKQYKNCGRWESSFLPNGQCLIIPRRKEKRGTWITDIVYSILTVNRVSKTYILEELGRNQRQKLPSRRSVCPNLSVPNAPGSKAIQSNALGVLPSQLPWNNFRLYRFRSHGKSITCTCFWTCPHRETCLLTFVREISDGVQTWWLLHDVSEFRRSVRWHQGGCAPTAT